MAQSDNIWIEYFENQQGSGYSAFRGSKYQNGNGFWGKILKRLKPALKYISRQGLMATSNIAKNMANGEHLSKAATNQFYDSGKTIMSDGIEKIDKMKGEGLKRKRKPAKRQVKRLKKSKKLTKSLYKRGKSRTKIITDFL